MFRILPPLAIIQFLCNFRRDLHVLLVPDLVLQTGPPVHRDRSELHFHLHHLFLIVKEDGGFNDQVQTAIAVGLRVGDVVLFFDQSDVILLEKSVRQGVDVRGVRADYPDARHIVQVLLNALNRQRNLLTDRLIDDALQRLQPRFDAFNGIAVIFQGKLFIQYVELGFDVHHRAAIVGNQLTIGVGVGVDALLHITLGKMRQQQLLQHLPGEIT